MPRLFAAASTFSTACSTMGSVVRPRTPREYERSLAPMKSTSIPGTDAMASMSSTACFCSMITTTRTFSSANFT